MRNSESVTFGGSGLDRAAELRGDDAKLVALWADKAARVLVLWRGKVLVDGAALVRLPVDHAVFADASAGWLFLGMDQGAPVFARDISGWEPEGLDQAEMAQFIDPSQQQHPALPAGQVFVELRSVMAQLSPRDAELIASAKSLFDWHRTHRFCSACGVESDMTMAGWQRDCPSCDRKHFPRTDPVVIMLITHGNSVLMGRSPHWPEGMYSLLAGFVEPGETIEGAVRREVFEEAGIKVGAVDYLASQPWPYPSSLMVGCKGEALSRDITIDPVEIEHALWLTREEMLEVHAGTHPVIKPARVGAIAHFLVQHWLADRLD
ncbi:MAG TPA: NAD(+) diphosphatase [Rhodobacteraceae bacterium]|nr:NAD(+) diphosphatase [Paracoccaceae bacterium]